MGKANKKHSVFESVRKSFGAMLKINKEEHASEHNGGQGANAKKARPGKSKERRQSQT